MKTLPELRRLAEQEVIQEEERQQIEQLKREIIEERKRWWRRLWYNLCHNKPTIKWEKR